MKTQNAPMIYTMLTLKLESLRNSVIIRWCQRISLGGYGNLVSNMLQMSYKWYHHQHLMAEWLLNQWQEKTQISLSMSTQISMIWCGTIKEGTPKWSKQAPPEIYHTLDWKRLYQPPPHQSWSYPLQKFRGLQWHSRETWSHNMWLVTTTLGNHKSYEDNLRVHRWRVRYIEDK